MSKIVLFGATGYTGGRAAEAMARRGLRPVLAGRDPARLAAVADALGGLPTARADVTDAASVAALVQAGDVLVTTVGPFARLGGAALRAAVAAGAVYFDSTGEPPFIREVHERHGPAAERTGAGLLTAFGNDFVPGVLAGALALRAAGATAQPGAADPAGRADTPGAEGAVGNAGPAGTSAAGSAAARVDVGSFITGGRGRAYSRGTLDSLIGVMARPGYAIRDGRLHEEPGASRLRTFDVAGRPRPAVSIGASEQFALPRLAPTLRTVDVYLGWLGSWSGAAHGSARVAPLLSRVPMVTDAATALAQRAVALLPRDPDPAALATSTSHFMAEVFDATGTLLARTRLTGPEPYAITAELLAWGAGRAAEHGVRGSGALDAVGAFGLDALVAGAAEAGIAEADEPRATLRDDD